MGRKQGLERRQEMLRGWKRPEMSGSSGRTFLARAKQMLCGEMAGGDLLVTAVGAGGS